MQLHDMSAVQLGIIRLIVEGPAWTTIESLAERLGYPEAEKAKLCPRGRGSECVGAACRELHCSGWLSLQERPEGMTVTLSSTGASTLGLKLSLKRKEPRWIEATNRRARAQTAPNDELDQVEQQPPAWYDDEDETPVHERYYRTGPHWIWLWTHEVCPVNCEHHQVPEGKHCLGCGRWVPRR